MAACIGNIVSLQEDLGQLESCLNLPHGTSHSISVVRRAYETWLGRPIRQEDAENFGMRLKGRPPHSFEKILDAETTAKAMQAGDFSGLAALVRCHTDTRFLENQLRTLLGTPLPSSVLRQLTRTVFSGDSEFVLVPTSLVSSLRRLMIESNGNLTAEQTLTHITRCRNNYRLQFETLRPLLLREAAEVLRQGIAAGEIIEYRPSRLNNPKQQPQGKCKSRVQYQPVVGDQDFLRPGDVLITKTAHQIALVHGADEKSATVVSLIELPETCVAVYCGSILSVRRSYESLASLEGACAQSLILENALALSAVEPATPVPEGLNPSQHRAIENVLDGRGMLYLIQGPPGTGKTTTVCKLIARILDTYPSAKLLVSAPSNRAVHELIDRLSPRADLPMVFFGVKDKITSLPVKDIFAEEFPRRVSLLLGEVERAKGKQQLEKARALHEIFRRWNLIRLPPEDVGELPAWIAEVRVYFQKPNLLLDILGRSSIVFLTLSTAGRRRLQELLVTQRFHYLIVDEAGQALDPELLIPMYCNPDRIILVGDVQQLGPTIVSQKAQKAGLDRSAMLRLQESQTHTFPVFLLDTQYRMDPKISYVSNHIFYGGKLRDAKATTRRIALPGLQLFRDHPFIWVDVAGKETSKDYSYKNLTEQALCIVLVQHFFSQGTRDVGIISPYALQVAGIKEALASKSISCPVASVDGFQGGEKDVVIISLVRTGGIGFVNHPQRLNVAITRAKRLLLIVGDKGNFEADPLFDRILKCPNVHQVSGQDIGDALNAESAEQEASPQSRPSAPKKKWRCPCGAENWPHRVECFKCRQARPQ